MYQPKHFVMDDLKQLHSLIADVTFGTIVTLDQEGMMDANHIPMFLRSDQGAWGTLYGHVAKANPLWTPEMTEKNVLAIFLGPNAYISPSWYDSKHHDAKVVPTWNYAAVHAYGTMDFFDDADQLLDLVRQQTHLQEQDQPTEWFVDDAPKDFIRSKLKGIVGFSIRIEKLIGKWKLGQNKIQQDQRSVVRFAKAQNHSSARDVATMMETTIRQD